MSNDNMIILIVLLGVGGAVALFLFKDEIFKAVKDITNMPTEFAKTVGDSLNTTVQSIVNPVTSTVSDVTKTIMNPVTTTVNTASSVVTKPVDLVKKILPF